jgi:hypothetical protein
MTDHAPDQELLARLRAADPASSLPAVGPDGVARLLEAAVSETATRPHESRETGTHGRSPLTWLVAAAAVLTIAGAGILGLAHRDHDPTPVARPSVTQLQATTTVAGLCVLPNPHVLRLQSVAFRGTLVTLTSRQATFRASHWYAGGPTGLVTVRFVPGGVPEALHPGDLTVGRDYLVAAGDGHVRGCGLTGPPTGDLVKLYQRAFG